MYALMSFVVGEKGNLGAKEAKRRARKLARLIHTVIAPTTPIDLSIFGYDEDARDLWDIVEARNYIITFIETLKTHGVSSERFITNTQFVVRACYAARAGVPVLITGTEEDGVRESVEQILEHHRTSKRFVH